MRRAAVPAAGGVLALLAWRAKVGPGSPLHEHAAYAVDLSPTVLVERVSLYLGDSLWQLPREMPWPIAAATLGLFGCCVWRSGSRAAVMGVVWAALTAAPILAIPPRAMAAAYLSAIGVSIALGVMLASVVERFGLRGRKAAALALVEFLAILALQLRDRARIPSIQQAATRHEKVRSFIAEAQAISGLCDADRLLLLDSRFGGDYQPLFVFQMLCDTPHMDVRIDGVNVDASEPLDAYSLVLSDADQRLRAVNPDPSVPGE